ncbi:MAG: DUF3854 domain-containing protein [Cyanobacteria bacterium P01_A01_bin.84]
MISKIDKNSNRSNGFSARQSSKKRKGFTLSQLDQFSTYTSNLQKEGFVTSDKCGGRIFQSDTSNCSIARLDTPIWTGKYYERYRQSTGVGIRFFKHFKHNDSKTVIITEGVFDALAAWTLGFNAIAYSGVNGAFDGTELHPDLEKLLSVYDSITIGFDIDASVDKQLYVEHHIYKLAKLLRKSGKQVQIVNIWDKQLGKDFSAILANHGDNTLKGILEATTPSKDWVGISASCAYTPTDGCVEDTQFISEGKLLELISKYKYVCATAPMSSGKTYSLSSILKGHDDLGVLIISPLKVLGKQITKDLQEQGINIHYRDDIAATANWERIVCCLESITIGKKLRFQADGSQAIGKILVIDEVAEVIEKLLESTTISKQRKEVVELLSALIRNAEKCLFLSADLTDFHVDVIKKLGGIEDKDICKYENRCKRNKFKGYNLGTVEKAVDFTQRVLAENQRVFLSIDSQKTTSTYGTGNLAELFSKGGVLFGLKDVLPELILILDSEAIKVKNSDAYKIVIEGQLDLIDKYLLVLASPSVQAGFSLKPEIYKPDAVVVIHMGASAPNGVCQGSMRVRETSTIPRYFGFGGYIGNSLNADGALSKGAVKKYYANQITAIKEATNAKTKDAVFNSSGIEDVLNLSINLDIEDLNLEEDYYKLQAIRNIQLKNRENYIFSKLRAQGATIEPLEIEVENAVKDNLKIIKERRIIEEAEREFNAPNIDSKTVSQYKEQSALTVEQHDSVNKYYSQKFSYRYDDVSTQDLIDKKLGLLESEELLFWLTQGRNYAEFQEQERILRLQGVPIYNSTKLLEDSSATKIFKHDAVNGSFIQKVLLLEKLGIREALQFALKHGVADLYLEGTDKQKFKPEPITKLCDNVRESNEFGIVFNWHHDKNVKTPTLFANIIKEIGYKLDGKANVRAKTLDTGKTKQVKLSTNIKPTRTNRQKRFDAYSKFVKDKHESFVTTQLFFNIGRGLIENEPASKLVENYGLDAVLESARRLPRADYGLSKHSQVLMQQHGFSVDVDIPVEIVTPDNVDKFTRKVNQWIGSKTEVGFDTETYESAVHKEHCFIKNGKWYWHNPQTKKNQQVKPGLDQNNNQVRLIQFSDGETTYVVDLGKNDAPAIPLWFKNAWVAIDKLTRQNTIVGHNLKFDTSSIKKYGLTVKNPYCTMLATKLLHGDCGAGKVQAQITGTKSAYGLASTAFNLLGVEVDKTEQMSNWGAEDLTDSQIIYAAKDAVLTLALKKRLELIFDNPKKWGFAEFENEQGKHANLQLLGVENRNIYHTTEMQWRGVPCDLKAVRECITKLEKVKAEVEQEWDTGLKMPCRPAQAKAIVTELNKRYIDREHPFEPQEIAESLGLDLDNPDMELPEVTENFTSTSKDVINDNPNIPELLVLKAWRSFNAAITQLSKVLLSVEINGSCKTEYGVLSGTGRMSCGNQYGLGTPNLQAFIKKAKAKFFGFVRDTKSTPLKFWDKPSIEETIPIRELFKLTNGMQAFFTEDANASHSRLAVGFGKCEFGKSVLEDESMDAHSMFSMMALQALLAEDSTCLDAFPDIRDFVKDLTEDEIRTAKVAGEFKEIDKSKAGKRFRDAAKTLFYSVLNGAQADKMRKILSGTIGQSVSVSAGETMFNKFWNLYQGIGDYIKKILAEAEENELNFGGIAFNLTTLPDGVKLLYARKNGDLATTNLIACQWSRSEATALKKIMASVETMPKEYEVQLINMVHDEVGIVCNVQYWQDAYRFTSDSFAREYDVYLEGFVPGDEPTEQKLHEKLFQAIKPHPDTIKSQVKIGNEIRHFDKDKDTGKVKADEIKIVSAIAYGKFWSSPNKPYIPSSWADK